MDDRAQVFERPAYGDTGVEVPSVRGVAVLTVWDGFEAIPEIVVRAGPYGLAQGPFFPCPPILCPWRGGWPERRGVDARVDMKWSDYPQRLLEFSHPGLVGGVPKKGGHRLS